jgi:hypothetical protein
MKMCNELKVGQLRKVLAVVAPVLAKALENEVMYVGNHNSFLRNTETGTETVVSNVWLRENTIVLGKYDDFKIDDPVMYKYYAGGIKDWCHGHFAGTNGFGEPMVFEDGRTSFTACGETETVSDVRHPSKEELACE